MLLGKIIKIGNHGTDEQIKEIRIWLLKSEKVRKAFKEEFFKAEKELAKEIKECLIKKIMTNKKEYCWMFVS